MTVEYRNRLTPAIAVLASLLSAPAIAQPEAPRGPPNMEDSVFDDTYITIGMGVSLSPSYDGSDDYNVSALPVVIGRIAGVDIEPRGPGLALDFITDKENRKVEYLLGPVGRARFNRNDRIIDPVVERLGELDAAVELGVYGGVKINQILKRNDSLTAKVDVRWDVAGAHNGRVISPNLTYFTPLNGGTALSIGLNADHVDDDFADYNFSISPAGSAASGLPPFNATGGWNNVGVSALGLVDLDGNGLNGGFSIIILASYSRLLNDAKRSPVTSIRGDANQWFGVIGVGYTF